MCVVVVVVVCVCVRVCVCVCVCVYVYVCVCVGGGCAELVARGGHVSTLAWILIVGIPMSAVCLSATTSLPMRDGLTISV